jgi:hypothetical protein
MITKEVMFLYGTGYKDVVHAISTNIQEYLLLKQMKILFRSVANTFGCRYV